MKETIEIELPVEIWEAVDTMRGINSREDWLQWLISSELERYIEQQRLAVNRERTTAIHN